MFDDYIKNMSDEEKIIFIQAFIAVISQDGKFLPEEKQFISEIAEVYRISRQDLSGIMKNYNKKSFLENVKIISDRKLQLQLIREMLMVMNVDSDANDNEIEIILKTAEILHIESKRVRDLNIWVLDQKIWIMKGRYLLEID